MPAATGMPPPTMAMPGIMPLAILPTCMLPPLPLQQPVVAPNSSLSSSCMVKPFGQGVSVAAEGRGDEVILPQRGAHADGGRLLALALVDRARHDAFEEEELDALLELPNDHHSLVESQQEVGFVRKRPLGVNPLRFLRYTHLFSFRNNVAVFRHPGQIPRRRP